MTSRSSTMHIACMHACMHHMAHAILISMVHAICQGGPASSYPPSHPPSDFRYTFPRPPTRNFARTPHEVLLLEYRQEEHGE